jgi:ribosomal protein S18 acetylase RimI-like enzyme
MEELDKIARKNQCRNATDALAKPSSQQQQAGRVTDVDIKHEIPSADVFCELRRSVAWLVPDKADASDAMCGTLFGVVAEVGGRVVGMGRVVGDGALCFLVQDLIVHPDFQRQGIGRKLMDELMRLIDAQARPKAHVSLFSAPGMQGFYSQYGFVERPGRMNAPGMVYIKT